MLKVTQEPVIDQIDKLLDLTRDDYINQFQSEMLYWGLEDSIREGVRVPLAEGQVTTAKTQLEDIARHMRADQDQDTIELRIQAETIGFLPWIDGLVSKLIQDA